MPTSYETDVLNATLAELQDNPFLPSDGITIQQVALQGVYPNTSVVVSYTRGNQTFSKSFLIYNRSYSGGAESPPAGTIASTISANISD